MIAPRCLYEREPAAVRVRCGDEAFAVAWTEGQAMPPDQAIAEALAGSPPGDKPPR